MSSRQNGAATAAGREVRRSRDHSRRGGCRHALPAHVAPLPAEPPAELRSTLQPCLSVPFAPAFSVFLSSCFVFLFYRFFIFVLSGLERVFLLFSSELRPCADYHITTRLVPPFFARTRFAARFPSSRRQKNNEENQERFFQCSPCRQCCTDGASPTGGTLYQY